MGRTLFDCPHEFRDTQGVGQPFQRDAVSLFEFEQSLVGDEGVRALVIRVDAHLRLGHGELPYALVSLYCLRSGSCVMRQ